MNSLFSQDAAALESHLQTLGRMAWLPAELLDIVGGALRLQAAERQDLLAPGRAEQLSAGLAAFAPVSATAHAQGAPLLPAADFPYEPERAESLWRGLCGLLADKGGASAQAVLALQKEVEADPSLPRQAFAAFCRDHAAFFSQWASCLPKAPALTRFLAQAALTPQLLLASAALSAQHEAAQVWEHGHCPHCGRPPFMGLLRGAEGQRWHVCSFCGAEWRAARLQCPFCLERGEAKMRVFSIDSVPLVEVQVCDGCQAYIKLADTRRSDNPLPAALSDLASLPLDLLARQEGFTRPTPSAWGF